MYIRLTMCIMNMPGDYCIIYDFGQRRHGLKKLGTGSCSFQTNTCKFLKAKLVFKTISDVYCEFLYCMCREIICNLLIATVSTSVCVKKLHFKMHSDTITLLCSVQPRFLNLFSSCDKLKFTGEQLPPPPTTTPLISGIKWDKTYCSLHK